jgi:hypothetical protein
MHRKIVEREFPYVFQGMPSKPIDKAEIRSKRKPTNSITNIQGYHH